MAFRDLPWQVLDTAKQRQAVVGWFSRPVPGSGERRALIAKLGAAVAAGAALKFGLLATDN